jgi:1-acyl-sn-glycerol-3-phosphate acyltransferase
VRALEEGAALAVFPQGTVLGHADRPWLRGAARLALTTGAPLLPVCLVDTEKALRPVRVRVGFPSVQVLFGEPIVVEPGPATIAVAKELTERVREAVAGLRAQAARD